MSSNMNRLPSLFFKNSALAANAFSHQNSANARRPDHSGRMELDEFHVDQLGTGVISERVAVAGSFPTVAM